LRQILDIVGEIPAAHRDGFSACIVDLNPIAEIAILILDPEVIGGHELGDHQFLRRQNRLGQGQKNGKCGQ